MFEIIFLKTYAEHIEEDRSKMTWMNCFPRCFALLAVLPLYLSPHAEGDPYHSEIKQKKIGINIIFIICSMPKFH